MKALIGMSGGVDSSVAAYLTQQAGLECGGATMLLYTGQDRAGSCSSDGVADARAVAQRLNMPFHVLDLSREFEQQVMQDFLRGQSMRSRIRCGYSRRSRIWMRWNLMKTAICFARRFRSRMSWRQRAKEIT